MRLPFPLGLWICAMQGMLGTDEFWIELKGLKRLGNSWLCSWHFCSFFNRFRSTSSNDLSNPVLIGCPPCSWLALSGTAPHVVKPILPAVLRVPRTGRTECAGFRPTELRSSEEPRVNYFWKFSRSIPSVHFPESWTLSDTSGHIWTGVFMTF